MGTRVTLTEYVMTECVEERRDGKRDKGKKKIGFESIPWAGLHSVIWQTRCGRSGLGLLKDLILPAAVHANTMHSPLLNFRS